MKEVEARELCQTEDIEVAGTFKSEQGPRYERLSVTSLSFALLCERFLQHFELARAPADKSRRGRMKTVAF